jgi:hypothetical protein
MRLRALAVAFGAVSVVGLCACAAQVVEAGPDAPASGGLVDVTVVVPTTTTAGTTVTSAGAGTSDTTAASQSGNDSGHYAEGDCLNWDQDSADAVFSVVSCDTNHLVEVTSTIDLSNQYPSGSSLPSTEELRTFAADRCGPVAAAYVGHDLTREEPGVILPSMAAWDAGDREGFCTVGLERVDGKRPSYSGTLRNT